LYRTAAAQGFADAANGRLTVQARWPFCRITVAKALTRRHREVVIEQPHVTRWRHAFVLAKSNSADLYLATQRIKVDVLGNDLAVIGGDELPLLRKFDEAPDDEGRRDFVEVFFLQRPIIGRHDRRRRGRTSRNGRGRAIGNRARLLRRSRGLGFLLLQAGGISPLLSDDFFWSSWLAL
jgi:hypothetical protein